MIIRTVEYLEFIEAVENSTFQNQDIIEVKQFGFKSVLEAFKGAELPWARFYLVEDKGAVLAAILEQRDGVVTFFTTTSLPGSDIRSFVKTVKDLTNSVLVGRNVLFIRVASWYKPAKALLRSIGFKAHTIRNQYEIWVIENGK